MLSLLNPTLQKQAPNIKSMAMILVGIGLIAMAIGRSVNMADDPLTQGPNEESRAGDTSSGFRPIVEMGEPAGLSAEKAHRAGMASPSFYNLANASQDAGASRITLPDGRQVPADQVPLRLVIPEIPMTAPVVTASLSTTNLEGERAYQWLAPDFYAAGWHYNSSPIGTAGNTVINGHHNAFGEVFRYLVDLSIGDQIIVQTRNGDHRYVISQILTLKEKYQTAEARVENARWITETADERLTLVTCWPYESNSHRLIVVARPLQGSIGGGLQDAP
ncbi:MAG: sortase [Anaerolineales bacterium]